MKAKWAKILTAGLAVLVAGSVLTGCSKKKAANKAGGGYPKNAIQLIAPVKAGGDTDANARLLSQYMSKDLKVSMPVVNIVGSSGTIGMEKVKSAKPDGYTALFFHGEAMLPKLSGLIDYQLDAFKMAGICLTADTTLLVTHKDTPYKNLKQLVEYAKANPGKVEFGMAVGGYPQMVGLALEKQTGIKLKLVDIGGNAAKIAALAGHNTDVINVEYAVAKDYIKTGEFVPLALLSAKRNKMFKDIPTAKEQGFEGLEFGKFFFVAFPKDTPDDIINTFSASMKKAVADPGFVKQAEDSYALSATYMDPAAATKYAQDTYKKWSVYEADMKAGNKSKK